MYVDIMKQYVEKEYLWIMGKRNYIFFAVKVRLISNASILPIDKIIKMNTNSSTKVVANNKRK